MNGVTILIVNAINTNTQLHPYAIEHIEWLPDRNKYALVHAIIHLGHLQKS